jgi:hypothetical protein
MKTKKMIVTALFLAGSAGLFSSAAMALETPKSLLVYRFSALPKIDLNIVQGLLANYIDPKTAAAITRLAPSKDGVVRVVSPKDPNDTFEFDLKTHDLHFHRKMARYLGDFEPKLPTKEEAEIAAKEFLAANKLNPADPTQLKLIHVGGLRAQTVINDKAAGPVIDKLITLNYSREVGGFPVIGKGSKMVFDIGEKGEVLGLVKRWRELESKALVVETGNIVDVNEAERLAKEGFASEFGKEATFEIQDLKLAYYDNGGRFLQPVYAFQAKINLPDSQAESFDYVHIVPAMKKPPEPLGTLAISGLNDKILRQAIANVKEGATAVIENE